MEDPAAARQAHWKAFVARSLNLGEGAELARETLFRKEKRKGRDLLDPALRGYVPIRNVMAGTELQSFRTALRGFGKKAKRSESLTELAMLDFATRAAERGAQTILLGTPNPAPNPPLFTNGESGLPVFNFGDPERYPLLYREDHRGDVAHLNHQGAEAFTVYLAERFAAHLRAHPPAHR
jgi:hypothetical protein